MGVGLEGGKEQETYEQEETEGGRAALNLSV